eukprot:TRINITY_DN33120_c0_g3_i1.p3 TRINITY_DN33120_c0_g3~~TRINITY_DN33120_c0_g3_i1.p3  ORF type:complete len:164 (-),score=11.22 TRINITY_DN33120_c0_g3_i1:229-720(-)
MMECDVSDVGCQHLRYCAETLTQLAVSGRSLSNSALAHLKHITQLQNLTIKGSITDDGMKQLGQLTNLTRLEIRESWLVTDKSQILIQQIPDLSLVLNGKTYKQEKPETNDVNTDLIFQMPRQNKNKIQYSSNELADIRQEMEADGIANIKLYRIPRSLQNKQ